MKKSIFLLIGLLLLLSVSSFATQTRVMTMGNNNMILLDDENIWLFPSRINDYPNIAIADFGYYNSDFTDFGINWQFDQENPWVLGTYFHNWERVTPGSSYFRGVFGSPYGYSPDFVPFDWSLMSNQRIDLFYGRQLSGKPFGFHFGAISSSQKYDEPDAKDEEGFKVYNFDFGLTLQNGTVDVAAGASFMTWTDKATWVPDSTAWDETKPAGNNFIYAHGRYFWQQTPTYTVIPHVGIYLGKNEAEYYWMPDSLSQTDKYTWTVFDLGSGLQYSPSNDVIAVLDFGIMFDKVKGEFTRPRAGLPDTTDEATETINSLPYFKVGLDAKVFNWMDVRFGTTSYWDRRTLENSGGYNFKRNYADNDTHFGFGFHWGNLHVDTYTDADLLLDGFYFISGESNYMNWYISALYEIQ